MTETPDAGLFGRLQTALAGQYRLERELGRGGMGVVFDATDLSLDRPVAIKVVHPELVQHESVTRRFLAEARMIARLRHPNIVAVHAAGEADGLLYYVMDRVPGESLRARLQREGRLPIAEARRILRDLAGALDAAGRAGLVHRDVKPENILLDSASGRALLVDFGIARAMATDPGRLDTGRGVAVGTPAYMSPEQAAGEEVDARSDIYSLGVVGYELLTGAPPFEGSNRIVVSKHLSERPAPVTGGRGDTPAALAAAVMRALEKHPDARWQAGADFRAALAEDAAAPPAPRPRWRVVAAAAVLLVAATGVALRAGGHDGPPAGVNPRHSVLVLPFANLREDPSVGWLRNGAVQMLTLTLSQWQDMHVVPPQRVHDLLDGAGMSDTGRIGLERALRVARDAGVWTVVLGTFERTNDTLRLVARVVDVASGDEVDRAAVDELAEDEVRPAFERLAAQLLDLSGAPGEVRSGLAQVTTTSVEAFRSYLAATDSLNHWNLVAAERDYRRALERDSTFALAWYRLALTRGWIVGDSDSVATDAVRRALLHRDRLPEHEQTMVRAYDAFIGRRHAEARALYDSLIARNPNDADAWYGLGDAWFHDGAIAAPAERLTPALRAFRRTLRLDPGYALAFEHVQNILYQASRPAPGFTLVDDSTLLGTKLANGRHLDSLNLRAGITRARAQAVALARDWVTAQPATPRAHAALLGALVAAEDWAGALAEVDRFRAVQPGSVEPAFDLARVHLARGDVDRAARELAPLLDSLTPDDLERLAGQPDAASRLAAAANVFAYRGNLARAAKVIDLANRVRSGDARSGSPADLDREAANWAMLGELYAASGAPPAAMRRIWSDAVEASRAVPAPRREKFVAAGGTAAVGLFTSTAPDETALAELESLTGQPVAKEVRALRAISRRDYPAARKALGEAEPAPPSAGTEPMKPRYVVFRRPLAAEAHFYLGEYERTLQLLDGFEPAMLEAERFDMRWGALGRVRLLRGAAYEKLGRRDEARAQYQLALRQWQEADEDLRPFVEQAQRGLARLDGRG